MQNNQSYEDYIRSILGYPMQNENMYQNNMYGNEFYSRENEWQDNSNLEELYPEIYKILYPMVQKACGSNMRALTQDNIDEMVEEIYNAIESDSMINVNINLQNENRSSNGVSSVATSSSSVKKQEPVRENRGETRQYRNRYLQDLIRILLIRELLDRRRPGFRPGNPGYPGNRPPYPGRPPFRPRSYELYENY